MFTFLVKGRRDYFSLSIFATQRQSIPIARGDNIWSSAPFVEDSMSIDRDYFSLPFVNQRQVCPLTRRDKHGHLLRLSKTQMSIDRDY